MAVITESTWRPVRRGHQDARGYSMDRAIASSSWYNKYIDNSGTRLQRLRRYNEADKCSVEISRALDIIAEDVSSCNADDRETFKITYPEDVSVKKQVIRTMEAAMRLWQERTGMDTDLFDRVRETLKYGATFYRVGPDGSLFKLPTERFVGYILSEKDEEVVTHYIYNPDGALIDLDGKIQCPVQSVNGGKKENYQIIPVGDLLVLKIGTSPFGNSIIEPAYKTWRKMSLLEDSIVIYRVVNSINRMVYYIDTGTLQGPKREAAIEKQRLRLMQKQAIRNGEVNTEFDPHSTTESVFIPTNPSGRGSRVEMLQASTQLGETGDLAVFERKMAAHFRIPNSMIDTYGDQQEQFTDMRVGQMYQIEMRYMGMIKRYKNRLINALHSNFIKFCDIKEINYPLNCKLDIEPPMSFTVYKDMEINQTALNVYAATVSAPSISRRYAMKKYLNMEEDDIRANEEEKLMELGIPADRIKGMLPHEIQNLVYSEQPLPAILEKYGIKPPEDQVGGGWG